MNSKKTQPYYTLNTSNPVLAVPELNTKFGLSILSNSLATVLENFNEARILQQLHFWLTQGYGVTLKGFRWIYKSIAEWIRDALPDLTPWTARNAVLRLEAKSVIIREKLHKEHHGHTYHTKNQTYYYRINYQKLQELISDRLKSLGINTKVEEKINEEREVTIVDFSDISFLDCQQTLESINPLTSSFIKNQHTRLLDSLNTSFLDCQKTDQNKHQNRLHTHIERESSTKDSTREQDREAIDHPPLKTETKNNSSPSIRDPKKDNLPPPVLQDNTERVTKESNEYQVTSNKYEAQPQKELVTRNSLLVTSRKYDRALGINPPEQQKDIQQRLYDWLPEGAWCVNGKLDPNFLEWVAQDWLKDYGGNIDKTKAHVQINFKKDPANIPIRWEQYRSQVLKRYDNASIRMANGVELSPEEQQELINHGRAIANPLCEEHSVVASLPEASPSNLVIGEIINGELLPSSDDLTINSNDLTSNSNNGSKPTNHTAPTKPAPKREVPRTKDGTAAENPEAYQLYQPEKIDNPANLSDLVARLRKATKGLATKFTMPHAEPPKEQKPLHIMTVQEVNELLQDKVMRADLLPKLHKSDRFEVFCNELGEVEYVDYAF